jgi:hypothetical protein
MSIKVEISETSADDFEAMISKLTEEMRVIGDAHELVLEHCIAVALLGSVMMNLKDPNVPPECIITMIEAHFTAYKHFLLSQVGREKRDI